MDQWRVVRVAPGEDGGAWVAALSAVGWERSARVLKREAGAGVYRVAMVRRDAVLKFRDLHGSDRLKGLFGATRAMRQWRGAAWLSTHGFRTARPYALLSGTRMGVPAEALVMEGLPGKSVLMHLADEDLTIRQEHAVARELGRLTARMIAAGRYNADGKPSNLIVTRCDEDGGDRPVEIAIIDCGALRLRSPLSHASSLVRMLASLVIEPIGVGVRPRRTLMMRALTACIGATVERWLGKLGKLGADGRGGSIRGEPRVRRAVREMRRTLWRRVERAVRDHGDPRPRVNPLHG
ncbi:MAG: hypothetical protein ACKVU4_03695 [Phycisphaerales bacterium]